MRVALGIASAIAASLSAGWLQRHSLRQASDAAERVERTRLVRLATERLRASLRTAHIDVSNYLLGGTKSRRVRAVSLPMWVYDPATLTFLDVNDATLRRYGYTREQFLSLALRDLRPPEELPALEAALRELPPQRYGLEARHKTRAGAILNVRIFAADIDFGGRRARLVLAEDITAYRAAEAETNRLREQLALTLDGIRDAVCLFARDGRFLFVNERARRLAAVQRPVQIGMKAEEELKAMIDRWSDGRSASGFGRALEDSLSPPQAVACGRLDL